MAVVPPSRLPPLIPPFRLCIVEEGVYRGAHPSLKNMRFMRRLKLNTIISLVPEPANPCRDIREYCKSEQIRHIWHHVEKYNDGFFHTAELVAGLLKEIIDYRNHPLFIHCRDGGHNTGLVIMCLRRLQNWALPAIYNEFIRYTKSNEITFEEKQFVQSFKEPVIVPLHIPPWLWGGIRHRRHPSILLTLEPHPGSPITLNGLAQSGNQTRMETVKTYTKQSSFRKKLVRKKPFVCIQTHYTQQLAGLDICGIYFADCCKPRMNDKIVCSGKH